MDKFTIDDKSGNDNGHYNNIARDTFDNGEDEGYHEMYLEYEKEEQLVNSTNSDISFILGIISIFISFCFQIYIPVFSIYCGIKAIKNNAQRKRLAIAGVILSIVSLILSFTVFLPIVIYLIKNFI
ncbi:MAG: DUF4190 domain-containing protein [Oscillospiraceae bacterium]